MNQQEIADTPVASRYREMYRRVVVPGMEWGWAGLDCQSQLCEQVYRLYAAQHFDGRWTECVVAVSADREPDLRADIDSGRRLLRLGVMLSETPDLAQAIQYSDRRYL